MQKLKAALGNRGWNQDSQQSYTPKMMEDFGTAVHAAWNLTLDLDKGVRAPLLDYAFKNKEVLLKVEGFKLVIQQTPQFACDLIVRPPVRKLPDKLPNKLPSMRVPRCCVTNASTLGSRN